MAASLGWSGALALLSRASISEQQARWAGRVICPAMSWLTVPMVATSNGRMVSY